MFKSVFCVCIYFQYIDKSIFFVIWERQIIDPSKLKEYADVFKLD